MSIEEWNKADEATNDSLKKTYSERCISSLKSAITKLEKVNGKRADSFTNMMRDVNFSLKSALREMVNLSALGDESFHDAQGENTRPESEMAKDYVTIERFDAEKIILETSLPQVHVKGYRYVDTHLGRLTEYAIQGKFESTHLDTPIFEKAEIHFKLFFGTDFPERFIPDGDNISIKGIIDALCPYVITNDDLMHLSIHISGKRSNGNSFMRVQISGTKE